MLSNVSGVTDKELSVRYRIDEIAIRRNRARNPIWKAAFQKVRKAVKERENGQQMDSVAAVAENLTEQLKTIGSGNNLLVARMTAKEIQKFSKKPPKLTEWSEANTAFNMLRKATGQESGLAVAVQVNMGAIFQPKGGDALDVETL